MPLVCLCPKPYKTVKRGLVSTISEINGSYYTEEQAHITSLIYNDTLWNWLLISIFKMGITDDF